MNDTNAGKLKRPRTDAVRNRELVLDAAREVFGAGGAGASLEAVARHAGVGIGTLYRHFPTRQLLYDAVYRREVEQLANLAEQPETALRAWMHEVVELVATKKGMLAALAAQSSPELTAFSFAHMCRAAETLLRREAETRRIRDDIAAPDLVRGLIGLCHLHEGPGWQVGVHRLVDVLADGLSHKSP